MKTFAEIEAEWIKDCQIDRMELDEEVLKISDLYAKYMSFFFSYRNKLKKMFLEKAQLKRLKQDYYSGDLNGTEDLRTNNLPPFQKKLTKAGVDRHVEADQDVIDLNKKIIDVEDTMEYLELAIGELKFRGNKIRDAIEWRKFLAGP